MFDIVGKAALPGREVIVTTPRSIDNRIPDVVSPAEARRGLVGTRAPVAQAQRDQLAWILACERDGMWPADGYRNFAEWVGAQLNISSWAARRRIEAAHALPFLPRIDAAFERGHLTLEHVVELCRFATPETEGALVKWARRVKPSAVRQKAEVELRRSRAETIEVDRARFLHYWWMDDGQLGLEGAFPPDQGAVIAKALDRMADRTPDVVEEDEVLTPSDAALEIRRADALYAMASARIANDQEADRATVVVHAPFAAIAGHDERGCEIEHGPAIHAETARRMCCDGHIEFVLHNDLGQAVGIGHKERKIPRWLLRQLKYRDGRCTFRGCEAKHFLHAHHIVHWIKGGPTDLTNLTLVCTFHHKLLHEYGWSVQLDPDGSTRWFRPGGQLYEPGRALLNREPAKCLATNG